MKDLQAPESRYLSCSLSCVQLRIWCFCLHTPIAWGQIPPHPPTPTLCKPISTEKKQYPPDDPPGPSQPSHYKIVVFFRALPELARPPSPNSGNLVILLL